jgi:uncharacterized membrane-anchored protein YitT (DUF2179 family)
LFGIPVGVGYFLVNIILLIIAMKVLGPKFGVKTIFAIAVGSLFLGIMQPLMPVDGILPDEKFMSTIIAAMLTGVGIGLSITVGGSTGGTDIIAMLVTKYHNVSPGRVLMVADFCVIAMTLLIYDPLDREAFGGLIYGYVMMGIVSFTVDYVLTGKTQSAQLFIFSEKYDEIARELTNQVHRGVTLIDAKGWYSGQEKKIIMIVARKYEASEVLRIARQIDANVFMTMAPVMGVFGKGFEEVKGIK